MKADSLRSWKPTYKAIKATPLYAAKGSKESVVREAAAGEILDMMQSPAEVEGVMWMKVQSKKDGTVGWTTFKGEDGAKTVVQGSN